MKLNVAQKAEAWKFSPKNIIQNIELQTSKEISFETTLETKIAAGPLEHQIQALSLKELEEQNIISVSEKESSFFFEDKNTERARLDRSLEEVFKNKKTTLVKFLKSPPTAFWINPYLFNANLEFDVPANINLSVLFFEPDTQSSSVASNYMCSFTLGESSSLEAGFNHSSAVNSFSSVNVAMHEKSNANLYTFLSGDSDYKRFELNIFKHGKTAHCSLNGLSSSSDKNIFDYHSNVFHLNADQETSQNFKIICRDSSKSIFSGRIHLTEKASGAQVDQLNNNLILGEKSSVDTQPELNIYQDNVKASHGATTSTLDESHLFYFSSRGFPIEQSRRLLLEAFCKSTCDNLKDNGLKQYFVDAISQELENVQ